jgi:hypothetical protein
MGRPTREATELNALYGWKPLRDSWRATNREQRASDTATRQQRKAIDKKRPKCRCAAYQWPHRPGGGLCRYPDPPLERYQRKPGGRPYRKRYAGLLRQIARANGLHPIRDRAAIEATLPKVLALAKQLHRQHLKYKYRNMEITENGITGYWTTAGPTM